METSKLVILAVVTLLAVGVMLVRPRLSLYLLVASFPFYTVPLYISSSFLNLSPQKIIGALTIVFFVFDIFSRRKKIDILCPHFYLSFLLLLIFMISALFNNIDSMGWIQQHLANIAFVFMISNWIDDRKQLNWLYFTYVASVMSAIILSFVIPESQLVAANPDMYVQVEKIQDSRLEATFRNPNVAAQAYLTGLGAAGAWMFLNIRNPVRMLAGVAVALTLMYSVLYTGSRSGFLALVVTVFLMGAVLWKNQGGRAILLLFLVIGVWFVIDPPPLMKARIESIPFLTEEARTNQSEMGSSRMFQYKFAVQIMQDHPLLGIGPDQFYVEYARKVEHMARALHSWFLLVAMEGGLPGLGVYLGLFTITWLVFVRGARKRGGEKGERLANTFMAINIVATAVFGLFGAVPTSKFFFYQVGLAAAEWKLQKLERIAEVNEEETVVVVRTGT